MEYIWLGSQSIYLQSSYFMLNSYDKYFQIVRKNMYVCMGDLIFTFFYTNFPLYFKHLQLLALQLFYVFGALIGLKNTTL
jgi:hypothetical protein